MPPRPSKRKNRDWRILFDFTSSNEVGELDRNWTKEWARHCSQSCSIHRDLLILRVGKGRMLLANLYQLLNITRLAYIKLSF